LGTPRRSIDIPRLFSRFAALSGIALLVAVALTLVFVRANVRHQARERAVAEAEAVASRLSDDSSSQVAFQYWGPRGKRAGDRLGFVDDFFQAAVGDRAGTRVLLYSPGGLVTYAADRSLIAGTASDPALIRRALARPQYSVDGGIESAYVPVESAFRSNTKLGVLRLERDYGPIAADIRHNFLTEAITVAAALLALYLAMFPVMRRVTSTLRRAYVESAELAAIVDHSNDAIIAHTPTGAITSWNAGAERIYGWTADEVTGRDIELLLPRDREPAPPGDLDLSRTTHVRKDGEPVQVSVTVSPVRDANGEIVGSSLTARDVTQLTELERELHELYRQEAVARLAGEVALDFDRILREIDVAVARADHPAIARATARGEALVRQLLEVGGARTNTPVVLDLNDAVEATLPDVRELAGPWVQVVAELEPELGSVVADAAQVRELILNLAANARAMMSSGGRLEIRTANVDFSRRTRDGSANGDGRHVMIAVSDSEPSVAARPAEPTDPGGRMALGLAAACSIVKQNGGTLGTETTPDGGSVIRVYLPRAAAPEREPVSA
jgi:PAS domain S-box-containing protein